MKINDKVKSVLSGVVLLVVVPLMVVMAFKDTPGVVILPGYGTGVGICGIQEKEKVVGDATVKPGHYGFVVVNKGHENDPQVKELMALTENECEAFVKGEK